MQLRAPAILVAARPHGETAVIARVMTQDAGLVAAYVAGGRGRQLRPVVIPGNAVMADIRAKSDSQLPFARIELTASRGPWLSEPLPAAAIAWTCALTATALPERQPYPRVYSALSALLDAICAAPSARGWVAALVAYETLLLREMGYGGPENESGERPEIADLAAGLEILDRLERPVGRYLIADARADVMAARRQLRERLARMDSRSAG
ncbi:DNA repair protein RecO C-terminal domain-containing protein [Qipengyuania sp. DY56-A-20]|jgi:DNA repair protein RecO (recombination protein O)|uniref:DNA repair protein RecO C-terminal domain-containing protein n=1 Tax=Qipengyuania benthica TaxID=3067651 RepID=A0ABT9HCC5_9SPHN|nr:DNA repair protein RecO C-terminal domain-containing protein [Qipengyuania sp. DY56-A-20]MDP4540980.1 DNA repair protein RecO C-terminal domain-containing protein [Qipengyuania sp. DY56-A-20]